MFKVRSFVGRFGKVPAVITGGALAAAFPMISSATGLGLGIGAATATDSTAFQSTMTTALTALVTVLIVVALGILAIKWVVSMAKRG
ncbi:hypothetical protein [Acidithiobacillus sp. HP-11]|uniref:hypothetical protein n=1 Tax=Acidithiobacillus sp. HP-11 TaxID=2697656 RepID=UPI00187A2254|nr:hypothetical protein [Acidithiobacillus sp. HP-11]MBE7567481.1 hypothetical protein [Acidithiobacillus sp. HP-11]